MDFSEAYNPLRALSGAARMVGRVPLALLAGGALLTLLDGGSSGGAQISGGGLDGLIVAVLLCGACVLVLVVFALSSLLRVGFNRSVRGVARLGVAEFSDLWRGGDRWLAMLLTTLLQAAILIAVAIPGGVVTGVLAWIGHELGGEGLAAGVAILAALCYLPFVLYVGLGLSLAQHAVALEDWDPISALERSWRLVDGHRTRLFVYWVALTLSALLGLLLCCVGLLLTGALAEVAAVESYLRLTTPVDEQEGWWLEDGVGGPNNGTTAAEPPAFP